MRKGYKLLFGLLVYLFILPQAFEVSAENSVSTIDIQVHLEADGSATITEKRVMEVSEGTEVYIELSNLGASDLIDFQVEGFEEKIDWDIDDSFEEKTYRYGVLEVDDGYELVWGMSEYGTQSYELTYGLTNLVRELDDGQAVLWNFDTFLSLPTEQMTLEVLADFDLSEELLELYGFGLEGLLDVVDGRVQWSGSNLDEGNDIILLMQFPSGTFQTDAQMEMTLAEQREKALEGSSYNEEGPMPLWLKVVLGGFAFVGIGTGGAAVAYGVKRSKIREEYNHFNPAEIKKRNKNRMDRKPPQVEGDLANYAAIISKLIPGSAGFSDFFFAYLLLWAEQGKVEIETQEEAGFFGGKKMSATLWIQNFAEEYEINSLAFDDYVELFEIGESRFDEVIWGMLLEVADAEGKIEGAAIEEWSEENAESVDTLIQSLETVSEAWLVEHGYLTVFFVDEWGAQFQIEQLTAEGEQLAKEIVQYENFIQKINSVSLGTNEDWENLILWSAIFGLAEETIESLEEFHPETWVYLEEMYPYYYGNYYGYHYLYARNTAGLASAGYSASGGMSSAGGGAGAGGGGGGGTR